MALGIGVFLVDAKVVPGGVSGLSMAVYYFTGGAIPVGVMIWVFNIPLYIWGLKELGKSFGIRTFFGFTVNSLFIDILRGDFPGLGFIRLQDSATIQDLMKHDFFFLILIGAVLLGTGLGIIFKSGGTTAGSDIVAAILRKKYGMKPGTAIVLIDIFVISIAGLVIEWKGLSPERPALSLTLYALLLVFVSSRLVDFILDGFDYAKAAIIISDQNKEVAEAIMHELSRGATALKSRGLYKDVDRELIYTVITNKELPLLTEIVHRVDPSAFMVINDVHEILGDGFRRRF
ncbi:MAG: hypothetical protein IFNCLDLE_00786 [Ignavibacteriaceae bacterium]|nr:hypothetical protein [Ignavibacteriaceae bacterium]